MIQTNYKEMKKKLENREPFVGNSVFAKMENEYYLVYSYNTMILKWDTKKNTQVYFNSAKYSSTTSRLQNMIRKAFDVQED